MLRLCIPRKTLLKDRPWSPSRARCPTAPRPSRASSQTSASPWRARPRARASAGRCRTSCRQCSPSERRSSSLRTSPVHQSVMAQDGTWGSLRGRTRLGELRPLLVESAGHLDQLVVLLLPLLLRRLFRSRLTTLRGCGRQLIVPQLLVPAQRRRRLRRRLADATCCCSSL